MDKLKPQFLKGDLVRCFYEFQMYYCGSLNSTADFYGGYFYGIVMRTKPDPEPYPEWGYYDPWYEVICFDGHTRFFSEWEIQLLGRVD